MELRNMNRVVKKYTERFGKPTAEAESALKMGSTSLKIASLSRVKRPMGAKAAFVTKVAGSSLKQTAMAYYRSKTGYVLRPKRGRTSEKDPVAVMLNRYARSNIGASAISYIYSSKSRVIRGTEHLLAVRLEGGARGWITSEGKFLSEEQLRNVLKSVDATSPASVMDVSLLDIYDSLTTQQKAEFAEKVRDFDWDKMFEEMYPKDGVAEADEQMDAYFDLLETLGDIKGWGKVI